MIFLDTIQQETSSQKINVNNKKESKREWKKEKKQRKQ